MRMRYEHFTQRYEFLTKNLKKANGKEENEDEASFGRRVLLDGKVHRE
jgi:myosin heavy subunit